MSHARLVDPPLRRLLRAGYRLAVGLHEVASAPFSGGGGTPRLWYGGAQPGEGGGPRVKIAKLREAFAQDKWRYNIAYLLSNAPYVPPFSLRRLRARGVRLVVNQNGVFYPAWFAGDWRAENARMARQYQAADWVFFQSDFCRRAAERFLGTRQGPGEILFNAIDTDRFVPLPGAVERPFTFLAAGKIQAHQAYRLETCVEGLAGARRDGLEARLRVVGRVAPEAAAAASALAARLGVADNLEIGGPYSQQEAPGLFAACDAYLMTNHNDACPSTVLEAMSCGLPVVYAMSGGPPELVGPEAGVGLPTGESWDEPLMPSARQVADGMLTVAENRATMGRAARARAVECFDIRSWLARHVQIFARLLEVRGG